MIAIIEGLEKEIDRTKLLVEALETRAQRLATHLYFKANQERAKAERLQKILDLAELEYYDRKG